MKAILTSAGFDNDGLVGVFCDLLGKPPGSARALFIPTALNTPEARDCVHVFKEDLYKVGIVEKNIESYDLDVPFDADRIREFDVILVCPGDPEYLLGKIKEMNFGKVLEKFQDSGGLYVGISAGSDIAAANMTGGLGYLSSRIECHSETGSECGPLAIDSKRTIKLTDSQAIVITDKSIELVE